MRFLRLDNGSAMYFAGQDSSGMAGAAAADTLAGAANAAQKTTPVVAQPVMRTPENGGYLKIAYSAAAIIYISYLVLMRRRWSALRARQEKNTLQSRR